MKHKSIPFAVLLERFPEVELPITLTTDTHHLFSTQNKPLTEAMVERFLRAPDDDVDEFTEFIACFRLPVAEHYQALVYWKASLMQYEYILTTFDLKGRFITRHTIAGMKSNGESILKRIATIDDEGVILVAEGVAPINDDQYEASKSHTFQLEISPTGDILQSLSEN